MVRTFPAVPREAWQHPLGTSGEKLSYVILFRTVRSFWKTVHPMSRFTRRCLGKLYRVSGSGNNLLFKYHLFSSINCHDILYHWIVSNTKHLRSDGIIKHWWKLSSLCEELRHSSDLVRFIFEVRSESLHSLNLLSLLSLSIYIWYWERTLNGKKSWPLLIRKLFSFSLRKCGTNLPLALTHFQIV